VCVRSHACACLCACAHVCGGGKAFIHTPGIYCAPTVCTCSCFLEGRIWEEPGQVRQECWREGAGERGGHRSQLA
jgi:hypothetical protein